jgi:hypothetical protein
MEFLSFIYIPFVLFIGLWIASKSAIKSGTSLIYLVYIEHMLFSYLFYLFAQNNSADANMYYARALRETYILDAFGTSTDFIIFITTFFVQIGFSKLSMFFLFGLFGFIGFKYLIDLLDYNQIKILNIPAVFLILLLPGFHFWTSAIGKDSLFFMFLMLFFYSLKFFNKLFLISFLSFTFLALIRPHMGFIILASIGIAFLIRNPVKYKLSYLFGGFFSLIAVLLFTPFVTTFLSIDNLEMTAVSERLNFYADYGANNTDNLSSYVDVTSYNLPMKMFAYLFRPLFFDAHSILQLLASFENTFLLLLVFVWLKSIKFKIFKWYRYLKEIDKILFIYLLIGWILLALSMYNLGLASRQKYMLLPAFFILIFRNLDFHKYKTRKR